MHIYKTDNLSLKARDPEYFSASNLMVSRVHQRCCLASCYVYCHDHGQLMVRLAGVFRNIHNTRNIHGFRLLSRLFLFANRGIKI